MPDSKNKIILSAMTKRCIISFALMALLTVLFLFVLPRLAHGQGTTTTTTTTTTNDPVVGRLPHPGPTTYTPATPVASFDDGSVLLSDGRVLDADGEEVLPVGSLTYADDTFLAATPVARVFLGRLRAGTIGFARTGGVLSRAQRLTVARVPIRNRFVPARGIRPLPGRLNRGNTSRARAVRNRVRASRARARAARNRASASRARATRNRARAGRRGMAPGRTIRSNRGRMGGRAIMAPRGRGRR